MATGTEVNKAVTSYKVTHSHSPSVMYLICSMKCCVLCIWSCNLPTSGLGMPSMTLTTPYVTESLLGTVGFKGCLFYGFSHLGWSST